MISIELSGEYSAMQRAATWREWHARPGGTRGHPPPPRLEKASRGQERGDCQDSKGFHREWCLPMPSRAITCADVHGPLVVPAGRSKGVWDASGDRAFSFEERNGSTNPALRVVEPGMTHPLSHISHYCKSSSHPRPSAVGLDVKVTLLRPSGHIPLEMALLRRDADCGPRPISASLPTMPRNLAE